MTHDPLCWTHIKGLPDVSVPCHTCEGIARVRADEREKAAQRVKALLDSPAYFYKTEPLLGPDAIIAAARGEA